MLGFIAAIASLRGLPVIMLLTIAAFTIPILVIVVMTLENQASTMPVQPRIEVETTSSRYQGTFLRAYSTEVQLSVPNLPIRIWGTLPPTSDVGQSSSLKTSDPD